MYEIMNITKYKIVTSFDFEPLEKNASRKFSSDSKIPAEIALVCHRNGKISQENSSET